MEYANLVPYLRKLAESLDEFVGEDIMKRFISLTLTLLMISLLTSCESKNNIKKLNYEGISDNWKISEEFNISGDSKIFMKYIGSSTIPEEIDFELEHLSGNTSGGNCKYSKTLGGFNIVFSNDDKLNDNIEMHGNKKNLNLSINCNNKNEEIKLQKVE
jgi:hypothetical protein